MPHTTLRARKGSGRSALWALACALGACGDKAAPSAPTTHNNPQLGPAVAHAAPPAPNLAGHRTSYDFVANRVHAHVHQQGRLVVDAGELDFLKYVDGGWKTSWILGEKDGGKPVAYVQGVSSTFFFPLDHDGDGAGGAAAGDLKMALTLKSVAPGQRLSVFVNEKPAGTIEVDAAWKDHVVTLPAAALVKGENRIRLTFRSAAAIAGGRRSAAAVERITIGPADPTGAPAAMALGEEALGGARKRSLGTAGPSRLSFYVQVPPQAQLALAYGAAGAGTKVAVRVARDGAAPKTLFEGSAEGRWTEGAWDLSAFADQAVRIDLVAQGGGVRWGEPRLVVKAPPPAPAAQKKFDRIYIWMVDTLRADKLRVYNPKAVPATPNFDAFANDATRFEWAQVPGTWSLPSHSSILTGVYPSVHKATAHDAKLSAKVPFTTEALKKAGYRTGLFSSNGYVSSKWGFDRSWDESRNFIRESLPNGAEYLWKTAKGFVAANDKKPQFLYLATVEPHVIYNPKKEFLVQYWNKPYSGPIKPVMTGIQLGHIKSGKLKLTETDKAYIKALYDAEVAQADAAFGAFVKDLKAAGTYDSTAIIIISDHGDEFWEHGDVGHAQGVHQELVRVPLIVRAPGLFPSGRVVKADVEAMDIHPTVLRLAGLEPTADVQGSDLLALALDEVANSPRASLTQNLGINRGMKVGRYRLIHTGIGRVGLFDVMKDPLEAKDVADASPIALRQMRNVFGLLLAFEDRWKKASWGTAANVREAFYGQTGS